MGRGLEEDRKDMRSKDNDKPGDRKAKSKKRDRGIVWDCPPLGKVIIER